MCELGTEGEGVPDFTYWLVYVPIGSLVPADKFPESLVSEAVNNANAEVEINLRLGAIHLQLVELETPDRLYFLVKSIEVHGLKLLPPMRA